MYKNIEFIVNSPSAYEIAKRGQVQFIGFDYTITKRHLGDSTTDE